MSELVGFTIVPFASAHRSRFRALNLEWVEEFFSVEARDREELEHPERTILAPGGFIFVALADTLVVGACALLRGDRGVYEIAKMAVAKDHRRRGIGRALVQRAVDQARSLAAPRVELLTHTRLPDAIRLYRSLGFVDVPVPPSNYARATSEGGLKMVLELRSPTETSAAPH